MPFNVSGSIINAVDVREYEYNSIIQDGLVLHLDARIFSTVTGTTWYDFSNEANNSDLTSGSTYSSDSGGCIVLDGVDDHIFNASPSNLPSGTGTILAWVYIDSTSPSSAYTGILGYGGRSNATPSDTSLLSINTSTGATWYVSSAYWYNDYVPDTLSVTKDAWNFVGKIQRAGTATNNTTLISGLNSVTGTSSAYTRNLNITSTNLTIGCTDVGGGRPLKGKISKVLVYDRELTGSEWALIYNMTKHRYGL